MVRWWVSYGSWIALVLRPATEAHLLAQVGLMSTVLVRIMRREYPQRYSDHRNITGPDYAETHPAPESNQRENQQPLVLKHDGGASFHEEGVGKLLERWGVIELTGPPHYPQYNGKKERSVRDIKSYERAMRRHGVWGSLASRLDETIHDLNEVRPRPVLGGRTAREVFENDRIILPDRDELRRAVERKEKELLAEAGAREHEATARRRAVEAVLLDYRLLEIERDASANFAA